MRIIDRTKVTRRRSRLSRSALGACLLGVVLLTGACQNYVALGDSYTSGPVIPNQLTNPAGCDRSDHNYPHLVAWFEQTVLRRQTVLRDVSCSGATTLDLTSPQVVSGGVNPPQLDSLNAHTRLVTLGIGGNDIGFTEIVFNCLSFTPVGTPCQDHYVVNGDDQLSDRIAATAPKIAAVLRAIHSRAPHARVFVVGYPAILPDTGSGCWPQMPFTPGDVPYLRAKAVELDGMLATQAAANHARYVDTYTPSIGHDACQPPGTRWIEPVTPAAPADPIHPNALGMQGMAAAVVAAIHAG